MIQWTNLFNQISPMLWAALIVGGVLFGIAFTMTHFWALKRYVFKQAHFKRALFLLSLVRLFVFAVALWLVISVHKSAMEVLIFFVAFMIGRWFTFFKTKRILENGKDL